MTSSKINIFSSQLNHGHLFSENLYYILKICVFWVEPLLVVFIEAEVKRYAVWTERLQH